MALPEEFQQAGEWLFRWRSYLPLLFLGLALYGFRGFAYPYDSRVLEQIWELACLAVALGGQAIRIYTAGYVAAGTSGRATKRQVAQELNTRGLYSIVRHPLYLGIFFIWLGVSLFPRQGWITLVMGLVFWLYYERIMYAEEVFLRQQFGDVFDEWAARTPAFIPHRQNWLAPELPFSWKAALAREYATFFAIVAVFTFLAVIARLAGEGSWRPGFLWETLFGLSLIFYLVVRFLKKKTQVLKVEGR